MLRRLKALRDGLSPRARQVAAAAAVVAGVVAGGHELGGRVPREVTLRADLRPLAAQGFAARSLRVEIVDEGGAVLRRIEQRAAPGATLTVLSAKVPLPTGDWRARVELADDARVLARDARLHVEAGAPVDLPLPSP